MVDAEKLFLNNYADNASVIGEILFRDLAGNPSTRTTNTVIFDNKLDNLVNVGIRTDNPSRLDNGTHQRYFAKENDNITLYPSNSYFTKTDQNGHFGKVCRIFEF